MLKKRKFSHSLNAGCLFHVYSDYRGMAWGCYYLWVWLHVYLMLVCNPMHFNWYLFKDWFFSTLMLPPLLLLFSKLNAHSQTHIIIVNRCLMMMYANDTIVMWQCGGTVKSVWNWNFQEKFRFRYTIHTHTMLIRHKHTHTHIWCEQCKTALQIVICIWIKIDAKMEMLQQEYETKACNSEKRQRWNQQ